MASLQIRHVPPAVHEALVAEADRRGESLQAYLLEVLGREANGATNRRLLADWARAPLIDGAKISVLNHLHAARAERDEATSASITATP